MKKSILTVVLFAVGLATSFAAEATLSYGASSVAIIEDAAFSDAFDNGVDAKDFNTTGIAVIDAANQRWASWATNDLSNVQFDFGFTAAPAADVVITVSGVSGDIYIDGVKLANGATITLAPADFNADGSIVAGKLVVSTTLPTTPKALIEGSTLTITGYNGKLAKITDANGAVIEDEKALDSDNKAFDLSAQPAGRYVLTLDGQEYQFDIKIPEIPEAKYHVVVAQP